MSHIAPWFPNAKFGVFVHWGLFSTMSQGDLDNPTGRILLKDDYQRRAKLLAAESLDMREWARKFKSWGAKYAVLTTKHAQGFCLWNSKTNERNFAKVHPSGRDLVREWCEAMREVGLKVGLYYSLADWGDDDFARLVGCKKNVLAPEFVSGWKRYIQMRDQQMEELLTNYGPIDLLWLDEDWYASAEEWESEKLAHRIEQLMPGIVINNRLRHPHLGHYGTPEQIVPLWNRQDVWELCDTLTTSPHWQVVEGSKPDYKRSHEIIRIFCDAVSQGGNYLLNVGPHFNGKIPAIEEELMQELGRWIQSHQEAVFGTSQGLPAVCFEGGSTRRGKDILYLFLHQKPRNEICLRGLISPVRQVVDLSTGKILPFRVSGGRPEHNRPGYIWIECPEDNDQYTKVLRVTFDKPIQLYPELK